MNIRYINIKQNKTKQNTALFQEMVVTFALPITYVKGFLAPRQRPGRERQGETLAAHCRRESLGGDFPEPLWRKRVSVVDGVKSNEPRSKIRH